jgi:hypothetical protein
VANFYFEIADCMIDKVGGKYYMTSKSITSNLAGKSQRLLEYSDRAWCEQKGAVWFIKHRMDPTAEVDLKEFMWIKLSAEDVRG